MSFLNLVKESVEGNFQSFDIITTYSVKHILDELRKEINSKEGVVLYLKKKTLCQIIDQYKKKLIEPELLNGWASMIRDRWFNRYYNEKGEPSDLLEIKYGFKYNTKCWNEMNEIMFRLYEIGDIIDGEILEEEFEDWLNNYCKNNLSLM